MIIIMHLLYSALLCSEISHQIVGNLNTGDQLSRDSEGWGGGQTGVYCITKKGDKQWLTIPVVGLRGMRII